MLAQAGDRIATAVVVVADAIIEKLVEEATESSKVRAMTLTCCARGCFVAEWQLGVTVMRTL